MSPVSDRRIDLRQLMALYGLLRTLSLRGQRDAATGKVRARPLVLVPTYLLFGATTFPTILQCADPWTAMTLVGAQLLGIGTLSLVPEALETTQRRIEIIHTKPIGELTFAAAQMIAVLTLLALVIGSLSVPPVMLMTVYFGVSPWTLVGWALLVGLLVFSLQSLWLSALWLVARRLGYERTRSLAQGVLILTLLSSWVPGALFRAEALEAGAVSFADQPYLRALPSAWAADLMLSGPGASSLALAALVSASLLVRARASTRDHQRRLIEAFLEASPRPGVTPLSAKLAAHWPTRDPVERAIGRLILVVMAREDHTRLRRFSLRAMILLTLPAAAFFDQGALAIVPGAMIGAMLLATELELLEDTHNPAAGAALAYAPIERRALYAGARIALLASTATFAGPIVIGLVIAFHPPGAAIAIALCLGLWAHAFVSLAIRARAPVPLSKEPRLGARFGGTIVGLLLFFVGATIYGLALAMPLGTILGSLVLAVLADRVMVPRQRRAATL